MNFIDSFKTTALELMQATSSVTSPDGIFVQVDDVELNGSTGTRAILPIGFKRTSDGVIHLNLGEAGKRTFAEGDTVRWHVLRLNNLR